MPFRDEDVDDIYQEHILDHYEDPYHRGDCQAPTHQHRDKNPLCGDVIQVALKLDGDKVVEAWFEGEGCVVSQASASMLMEQIEGKSIEEVKEFNAEEMLKLYGARLTPNRQKCCLLSWKVVQSALHAPLRTEDEETGDDRHFGGPNLGEES